MVPTKRVLNRSLVGSGAVVALSGGVLQVYYHLLKNTDTTTTFGLDRAAWNGLHVWSSVLFLVGVALHLWRHRKWVRGVIKKRLFAKNRPTIVLIALTFLTVVFGLISLFVNDLSFVEIHDKVSIGWLIVAMAHTIHRKVL